MSSLCFMSHRFHYLFRVRVVSQFIVHPLSIADVKQCCSLEKGIHQGLCEKTKGGFTISRAKQHHHINYHLLDTLHSYATKNKKQQ